MSDDVYADFSAFYDLYVGEWRDDVPLYLERAKTAGGPVLEIGAGSGRLTVPLARAGFAVTAVDVSASMLALLRSRLAAEPSEVRARVRVVQADATRLALAARYPLVLVPFYTFNYFLTPEAQRALLDGVAAHLAPGGRVLVDVFIPYARLAAGRTDPILKVDRIDPATGGRVRGWNTFALDPARRIETRRQRFEIDRADGTVEQREFTIVRRWEFPEDLERIFAAAGFAVEDVFAGYARGRRPEPASEQRVYVLVTSGSRR
ncbi:MAG TPA: methyltransferase domain-containing protein [Methylomirabilota bacterium]|nr:methyltransferase domain-containing protein [Methylomirabilota bacterium]